MRYNIVGDGFYNLFKGYTWLRSGADMGGSYYAYYHSVDAVSYIAAYSCIKQAVRPATHKAVGLLCCHPEQREGSWF